MADTEDLVALILASLEPFTSPDLSVLSLSLADESSLQLQRLWLLLGSPSQSLDIISFLDSLSIRQRRLLLGRVTLRLIRRITDFLEEHAACKSGTTVNDRPIPRPCGAGASPSFVGDDDAPGLSIQSYVGSIDNAEMDAPSTTEGQGVNTDQLCETSEGPEAKLLGGTGSTTDEADQLGHNATQGESNSPTTGEDLKINQQKILAVGSISISVEDSLTTRHGEGIRFQETRLDHTEENNCNERSKLRQDAAKISAPGANTVQHNRIGNSDPLNIGERGGQRANAFESLTSRSRRESQELENRTMIATDNGILPTRASTGRGNVEGIFGVDNVDNVRQSWGDTDAAFLLLFLSETQEQECQEAMKKWCIDPYVYRHLIVRDMAALVDDESKGGLIRAPKWRESLQEYLLQNILQMGYGVPGMMTSANFPASLSAYIDTIGRFQRLLRNVNGEVSYQQRVSLPPASAATLLSLPTIAIGSCKDGKGKLCSICGEEFEATAIASRLPCLHVYHWDCILPWLKQRNTCPVCRHELPTDDLDYELHRQKQLLSERAF